MTRPSDQVPLSLGERLNVSRVPFENSHVAYVRALQAFVREGDRWLDLGCGHSIVPDWLPQKPAALIGRAVGLDRDREALRMHSDLARKVAGDAHVLPFRAEVFDAVTANMVVEHIREPVAFFQEVHRVLRPGGRLLIHTPNALGYTTRLARLVPESLKPALATVLQRRASEDVYPTFYRANTRKQLAEIATQVRMRIERCEYVMTSPQLERIPLAGGIERLWMRHLAKPDGAANRPVLIAVLVK